jgi:hypothetical protein
VSGVSEVNAVNDANVSSAARSDLMRCYRTIIRGLCLPFDSGTAVRVNL